MNLGATKCLIRKATPKAMQIEPTTIYAIPRKGFFPPIHEEVEITKDLVPWKIVTG